MAQLHIPAQLEQAPVASQPLLQAVKQQIGSVPNLFRLVSNSPAALEGYLNLSGALGKGSLPKALQERISLAISEFNGCEYCLAAHSFIGKNLAKMDEADILASRRGHSADRKSNAALVFALAVATQHGKVGEQAVAAVKAAGFSDAEIVEIVQHVALNTWTNYINLVAQTEVDFPAVTAIAAA